MANYRVPRGYARRHPAYQEVMEGVRPTIKGLKAAPWLPIAEIEPHHNDPIVLPAGTWVGILGADETGGSPTQNTGALVGTGQSQGAITTYFLAPASTGQYTLTYTTNDSTIGALFNVGNRVIDIDTNGPITDANAVASDAKIGALNAGVKPVGVLYNDVYASWLGDQFLNYERQPNVGLLMHGTVIQVPCVTTQETQIEPGDMVAIDGGGASPTWQPSAPQSNRVGHLVAADAMDTYMQTGANYTLYFTGAYTLMDSQLRRTLNQREYIVGRCIRKIKIALPGSGGGSAAASTTKLETHIANGSVKADEVAYEFRGGGRVNTVPGLALQGSGSMGIPGHLLAARADSNGVFWALEIAVSTY
jgi:hypothetical protein